MNRKDVLRLTADERGWLEGIVRSGKSAAWKIWHADVFLKMDCGAGPALTLMYVSSMRQLLPRACL